MFQQHEISQLAGRAPDVDLFAERVVEGIIATSPTGLGSTVRFDREPGDSCSFIVFAHRKAIHFGLEHAVYGRPNGKELVGLYRPYTVDKNGKWTEHDDVALLYPANNLILDDGSSIELPTKPTPGDFRELQDGFTRFALKVVHATLTKLP